MRTPLSMKSRLLEGEPLLGPWCVMPSETAVNAIAASGVDFVIVDREHGAIGPARAEGMIRAAQSEGCGAIVRIGSIDEGAILHSLDSGADGVLVAHVETPEDARRVVSLGKYSPLGSRGFSPYTRAGGYGLSGVTGHAERSNEGTLIGVIIEGRKGIDNLSRIAETPELDFIYIGAYDLSQALGIPGQVTHPDVKACLEESIRVILKAGKIAGGYVAKNEADLRWMVGLGMRFITWLPDVTVLHEGYRVAANMVAEIKKESKHA